MGHIRKSKILLVRRCLDGRIRREITQAQCGCQRSPKSLLASTFEKLHPK
jgi:hypothetical protein